MSTLAHLPTFEDGRAPESNSASVPLRIPVPTLQGWGVMLLCVILVISWKILTFRELLLAALLCGSAAVIDWALLCVSVLLMRLRVDIKCSNYMPSVGEKISVCLLVRHRLRCALPLTFYSAYNNETSANDSYPSRSLGSRLRHEKKYGETDASIVVPGRKEIQYAWHMYAERRGRSLLRVYGVRVVSTVGLMHVRLSPRASATFLCVPALLPPIDFSTGTAENGEGLHTRPSVENIENTLRDYHVGDPLNRIHWKQSARQGRLLVHESENNEHERIKILLVTDQEAYSAPTESSVQTTKLTDETIDPIFERAVSVAASVGVDLIHKNFSLLMEIPGSFSSLTDEKKMRNECEYTSVGQLLAALALVEKNAGEGAFPAPQTVSERGNTHANPARAGEIARGNIDIVITGWVTEPIVHALSAQSQCTFITCSAQEKNSPNIPHGWHVIKALPTRSSTFARGPR